MPPLAKRFALKHLRAEEELHFPLVEVLHRPQAAHFTHMVVHVSNSDLPLRCLDHFVNAFDQDVTLRRDESTEEADEVRRRLVDCASENARVEIALGSLDSMVQAR